MRYRLPAALLLLCSLLAALWWFVSSPQPQPATQPGLAPSERIAPPLASRTPAPGPASDPGLDQGDAPDPESGQPGMIHAPARPRAIAAAEEKPSGPEVAPGLTPAVVLENMRGAFRQYSSRFGGNPVGTNREITSSLNGGNPAQVVFIAPEDGLQINQQGELVDNWGTPYFFHQLSAAEMEIHSAGPDRRMWTTDDLVMK